MKTRHKIIMTPKNVLYYTPFSLSGSFLYVVAKLKKHDYNTDLNMICSLK